MTRKQIVTVTLNPAIDMTGSMASLQIGSVNSIREGFQNPAGKGINVAKVLAELGADVTVTGFLGQANQDSFVQLFNDAGMTDRFIRVQGNTRINVKLVEETGRVTDLNFPGVQVTDDAIAEFEKTLFDLANTHDVFVIAGSLPSGVTPDQLCGWIQSLNNLGKKVFFDSSNQALTAGLRATPWLVKPNDEELSQWVGHHVSTKEALLEAGEQLSKTGISNVVISRGAEGVLWCHDGEWLQSTPPKMQVISTVGAGDTLVAGMCWAAMNDWSKDETLGFATALSALAVTQINVGVSDLAQVEDLQRQIRIQSIQLREQ